MAANREAAVSAAVTCRLTTAKDADEFDLEDACVWFELPLVPVVVPDPVEVGEPDVEVEEEELVEVELPLPLATGSKALNGTSVCVPFCGLTKMISV